MKITTLKRLHQNLFFESHYACSWKKATGWPWQWVMIKVGKVAPSAVKLEILLESATKPNKIDEECSREMQNL